MTARRGIFKSLLVLTLVAALVPLLGLGVAALLVNVRALELEAQARYLAVVSDVKSLVRAQLDGATDELRGVAQLLADASLTDDTRQRLMANRVTASSRFDVVGVYTLEGRRLFGVRAQGAGSDDPPETLPVQLQPQRHGGRVVGDVQGAGDRRTVLVAYRYDAAELQPFILLTQVRLASLVGPLGELGERLGDPAYVTLVNRQHQVILRGSGVPDDMPSLTGRDIFTAITGELPADAPFAIATDFTDDSGRSMVGAVQSVPETGWAVVVKEDAARARWALSWLRTSLAVAVLLGTLLVVLLAVWGARRLTRPIQLLVDATRQLAARTFTEVSAEVTRRPDELGGLGQSFNTMARDLRESEARVREEELIRASLSRYLPGEIVEKVVKNPGTLKLGGQQREVTVLFADIVGFTRMSEALPPETVVSILNEHFTVATEVIHRHGGVIDKFIGDCVMAVWGAIETRDDDADRAMRAAEDMRRWLDVGNRRWKEKFGVELKIAIGLHSGKVVAGNLGSEKRMEFTVIGDVVNVAARLEAMAQPGQILVSGETRLRLSASQASALGSLGEQTLRGRVSATEIFEVSP